jgi:phosphopantetheinyl transferase
MDTPADTITTVKPDGRQACPLTNGAEPHQCSVSHDSRFAVAAVSERRIGIDVEEISERVLKSRRLYMHEEELALVRGHAIGEVEASARVWSIKEAVSKALGVHLADAWLRTRVKDIGYEKSVIMIDEGEHEAIHAVVDGHLFTLITI